MAPPKLSHCTLDANAAPPSSTSEDILRLPPGMPAPDYEGGSLVNLMGSLISARGGTAAYPPLPTLRVEDLADTTSLVLLVIDGLGADWLARQAPDGLLARHRHATITSVFPPTTAAAIPTFLTGLAPQQHGLTGWHTYLRELGSVMTVLPGHPRYGGASYRAAGIDPERLFTIRPVFEQMKARGLALSPAHIAYSDFNRTLCRGAEIQPFQSLTEMFCRAGRALRRPRGPQYLYLYWPELDRLGHEQGIDSPAALAHLHAIEAALADFIDAIAGTDTLLLITADHGQLDTTPEDRIELDDHPGLTDCLTLPLCGEPRTAYCYLRPGRVEQFIDSCRERLGERALIRPSSDLIAAGLFGRGAPHPRLAERVGDYALLMRGTAVIRDRLPFEEAHRMVGVHGGLSAGELRVPLCLLRP
ncbi:putative AP superfamily protein [Thioflavicoccus mobilis 8321]|uniref:Putative AP superfamily protein n=1 Tax=Thioflavicoccus mobilis 8321 TaxID=765912 RepID=L0H0C0_9GAMM|nr:alkaline phosphatase family protein [Thioflavicoccus mobilis]AGA91671.1 putative AP superfamily protein [Thioflavicoccus mobilis 8321]